MTLATRIRAGACVLLLAAIALCGGIWWELGRSHDALRADTRAHAENQANQLAAIQADHLEALLLGVDQTLRQFRDAIQSGNRAAALEIASSAFQAFPKGSLVHFSTVDAAGYIDFSTMNLNQRYYVGDREYFAHHASRADDQLHIEKPLFARTNAAWLIFFTRPILQAGKFAGIAVVSLSPEYLSERLAHAQLNDGDVAAVYFTDGAYLARSHNVLSVMGRSLPLDRPSLQPGAPLIGLFRVISNADGLPRLFAYRRLSGQPLIVNVGLDERKLFAATELEIDQSRRRALLGFGVLLVFSAILAWALLRMAKQQARVAEGELLLRSTMDSTDDGLLVVDDAGHVMAANARFRELWRIPEDLVAVGDDEKLLAHVRSQLTDPEEFLRGIAELYQNDADRWDILHFKDGRVFDRYTHAFRLEHRRYRLWSFRDVTARKLAEEEIRTLAFYDPLTRLPNRRLLLDRVQHALTGSARNDRSGALMMLDLDDFKTLNDTLGHEAGDRFLVEVAGRLQSCVRASDTVARQGGDEFVVLLENMGTEVVGATQAEAVAMKILSEIVRPCEIRADAGSQILQATVSIGIALFRGNAVSGDELIRRADTAMYRAKASGRNAYRFFDQDMHEAVIARAAFSSDLRHAVREGQFVLYFQPQVDAQGRITGAEALVRWNHPQRGLLTPNDFIPLAEETGVIYALGNWVLDNACRYLAVWSRRYENIPLSLAVNVSPRQFRHPDFVSQVLTALETFGADPHRLKLEVTESLLLDDVEDTAAKMGRLRAEGVRFALDDFGTGYSSLAYLKGLPFDQIKVDRSFVLDVMTDPNDAAIAKTIVGLGHNLGLEVIAEGVETEDQRVFLAGAGCLAYQGYLFDKPMPAEDFESRLQRRAAS